MKKLLTLFSIFVLFAAKGYSTARLQIIHNSADAAAATVDIYVNGGLFKEDVAFRTATAFEDVPSGVSLTIDITPPNTSLASSVFNTSVTLTTGETYVVVANGIVSPSGYSPATPFNLFVYALGRETSGSASETDVMVFHGATDAPTVDVVERGVGAGLIIDDMAYGDFTGYLDLPTADYEVEVRDETGATTVACYSAPLASLNAGGAALVVVASGFLDPSANSNGEAFGLYAALPSGGSLLALPACVTTGVEDLNSNALNIYPNPLSGNKLAITSSEVINEVAMFDLNGALIATTKNVNSESVAFTIPSSVSNGIYIMQVKTAETTINKRIVVE